jgi:HEAT repeat protein
VSLHVEQTQAEDANTLEVYRFEVDVELRDGQGPRTTRLTVDQREQEFLLPAQARPIWVRFDKHSFLPARIVSTKKGSEWLAIAAEDDDVNGRRDAVDALGRLYATEDDDTARAIYSAAILRRLRDDEQSAVRYEAVEAFGRVCGKTARQFLEQAASQDESAQVRTAALKELGKYPAGLDLASFAQTQFDAGFSWETRIASAELYCVANPAGARQWLLDRSHLASPHSVLRSGLLRARIALGAEAMLDELVALAGQAGLRENVRQEAVRGLGKLARLTPEVRNLLFRLLTTDQYRLRQDVIEALGNFQDELVVKRLRRAWKDSLHSRERRRLETVIAKLSRGNAKL